MSIVNGDKLDKKFAALESMMQNGMQSQIHKMGMEVRDAARLRCPERRFGSGGGALRQSIHVSTEEKADCIVSTVYTNLSYAAYVEFGTGPVGQEKHQGISPDINPAYSQTGWIIPGDAMGPQEAEQYGLGIMKGKDGRIIGYMTNGQPAQPYMYPALKDNEERFLKDMKTEFIANIKKVTK